MNQRLIVTALLAFVLGIIALTYSNHFHNDFHFDDAHTVRDNGYIRDLKNIPLFFTDCATSSAMPSHQGYRPLVTTTLAIDYWLSKNTTKDQDGYNVLWYHLSNFSWFLMIVVLMYFVQRKIYNYAFEEKYNHYFALLGCLWYGLTTANAETVNYIISRSDILSTLAIIASFAVYTEFPKWRKYYLYLLPAIIGMFAKETTIMFAPALIAYDFMIEKQKSFSDLFSVKGLKTFFKSIVVGLPALVICVALAIFAMKMTKVFEMGGYSTLFYAVSQPYIILHYVTQFFFPFGLSADTDIPMVVSLNDDRLFIGFAFLIGLIILAFKTSETKQWRPFSFGLVWFLLMLLPTSSFIALAEVTNDHRVFLPYIGLIISMITLLANLYYYLLKEKVVLKYGVLGITLLAISGYAYGTHQRNKIWKTDETLWKDVTEKSPNNGRGWMNYGLNLMSKGDYTNAEYAYNKALEKAPRYYILHINMGVLKDAQGKKTEAEQYYKNALSYGPNYVEPYYYYARFLFNSGRVEEAEIYCSKGLELFSGHLYSRYLLMDIYNYQKNWNKLLQTAQATLSMYPDDPKAKMYLAIAQDPSAASSISVNKTQTAVDLLNQSLAYYSAGKYRECIDACFAAIGVKADYPEAYNNICSAYNQLGIYDSAVWACSKAIELKPDFPLAKNNLKWAKDQLKK